ncbi:polysaccharide deacetylase family protein [Alkalisalibacterium limincola]|uniref:Polysaccharide deacetylase family protein n=1 Tax=Alkalisalibacterium limincola TaxID=2699169 RepID=A0A5C8KJ29_9GAMM|nr:polysaccharide deacetylase family protein [Alkalisalibacterium limincola]TXK60488.1 polysaccharide deacetylase family protein [Alkalisalibacterium limincola]
MTGPGLRIRRSWRPLTWAMLVLVHLAGAAMAVAGHWTPALALVAASHLALLWGTLRPASPLLGAVATGLDTQAREVWLTIDDGPSPDTAALLDVLDRHQAKATWFVVGERAGRRPDAVAALYARGHQLGNHSQSHPAPWFWALPPSAIAGEIGQAQLTLSALGPAPRLFRAVVGMANPFVAPVLARHGLVRVGWSARGFDATTADPEVVVRRILRDLRPGAIILLHEGAAHGRSVEIITRVLDALSERGYRCVLPTLSATPPPASC